MWATWLQCLRHNMGQGVRPSKAKLGRNVACPRWRCLVLEAIVVFEAQGGA